MPSFLGAGPNASEGLGLGGAAQWTPAALSATLEWFDVSTLTAGSVAALTGRKAGWSLAQAVAGAKPTASQSSFNSRPGLSFDGGDLLSGSVDLSAYASLRIVMAMIDTVGGSTACYVMEQTASFTVNNGGFAIGVQLDGATAGTVNVGARGSVNYGYTRAPEDLVSACVMSFAPSTTVTDGTLFIRKNGVVLSETSLAPNACGAGNFANSMLHLGARSGPTIGWTGIIGPDIVIMSGTAQDADLALVEAYVTSRAGL